MKLTRVGEKSYIENVVFAAFSTNPKRSYQYPYWPKGKDKEGNDTYQTVNHYGTDKRGIPWKHPEMYESKGGWSRSSPFRGWNPNLPPKKQNWSMKNQELFTPDQKSLHPFGRVWEGRGYSEHLGEPRIYFDRDEKLEDGMTEDEYKTKINIKKSEEPIKVQKPINMLPKNVIPMATQRPFISRNENIEEGIETVVEINDSF